MYTPDLILITAITENPVLRRYDIIERNVAQSNVETVNHLELVVSTMSGGCQSFPENIKISRGTPQFAVGLCGTLAHNLGTTDIATSSLSWIQVCLFEH